MPTTCMPEQANEEPMGTHDLPRGQETILLAEDLGSLRGLFRLTLRSCGYTVWEAADGAEAIRIGLDVREPIHLLVTDQHMPLAFGSQVAAKLRGFHPEMRVLYVTGHARNGALDGGEVPDSDHLLEKPFGLSCLARKVRAVLDRAP